MLRSTSIEKPFAHEFYMQSRRISALIAHLKSIPSSPTVTNPYLSATCCDNLSAYLRELCATPYSGFLLIGEAPGYLGCARTGIPFTSEGVLKSSSHYFLKALYPSLTLAGSVVERTATFVWDDLSKRGKLPAFWNAFPFHPHCPANSASNRTPTRLELRHGAPFVFDVIRILCPHTVVAVGRKAWWALGCRFPRVRHPSFGGGPQYALQIDALGII